MIISVLNQKGGVGKTTLSISLAAALAGRKLRVLLVDADPQGSALDWIAVRQEDAAPFAAVGPGASPAWHRAEYAAHSGQGIKKTAVNDGAQ